MSKKINDGLTRDQRKYRTIGTVRNAQNVAEWRAKNPERANELSREYYERHAQAQRDRARKYYQEKKRKWQKTKEGKLWMRLKEEHRRGMRIGRVTSEDWVNILREHDEKCAWCHRTGVPLEMDHVMPLSKGGKHEPGNIVPACKPCNSSRGNRHPSPLYLKGAL
jgi:5-methylcytosine-specific restriction endonuclease McrA